MSIGIVDYGLGNVGSVRAALSLSDEARAAILSAAGATAAAHSEARIAAGLAKVFEEL